MSATLLATVSCRASYPGLPTESAPLIGIGLYYSFGVRGGIYPGTFQTLAALSVDGDAAYRDVTSEATWSSSNLTVARVAPGGAVTIISGGSADIYAAYKGLVASTTLMVQPPPVTPYMDVYLPTGNPSLASPVARGLAQIVNGAARNVTAAATWASSDPRVATVDGGGVVTAVASGTVEITATAEGLSGRYRFSVFPRGR